MKRGWESKEDPIFRLYLRDVAQTALLTPEQENALAALVQAGDLEAREMMIKANLRLVIKIARDYENFGLPLMDLINEGNIGLMRAVEKFDPCEGVKLSTYAALWIKQAIIRALANQSRTIRLPVHMGDRIRRFDQATSRLRDELGVEPTDEEVAEVLDLTSKKVLWARTSKTSVLSLDAPRKEGDTTLRHEDIEDPAVEHPSVLLHWRDNLETLMRALKKLPKRLKTIIQYRFLLEKPFTLEEVGEKFAFSRERARQLQNEALEKLRMYLARGGCGNGEFSILKENKLRRRASRGVRRLYLLQR